MKKYRRMTLIFAVIIVGTLLTLAFKLPRYYITPKSAFEPSWGITFSKIYAESLGLSWHETYRALISDLGVKKIRLPVYWSDISSERGKIRLDDYEYLVGEAKKYNVDVVIVVGERLPRWPECHAPLWAKDLSEEEHEKELMNYISSVVNAFKGERVVRGWQVENEPLVWWFGKCGRVKKDRVRREVALVRSLDTKPIMITDSGELGTWKKTFSLGADKFGFTMYRVTWNTFFGYFRYPLPPSYYRFRAWLSEILWSKTSVAELQAEPWIPHKKTIPETALEEQFKSMNPEQLRANLNFARALEAPEAYLWGAEWWYYLKGKGDERMWEEAKQLFNP